MGGSMAYNWLRLAMGRLWAPLAVLALAPMAPRAEGVLDLWWLLHILCGAAIAFCFTPFRVLAFAIACTGAVAWEAGEFAMDQWFGTALQEGNLDTMTDLLLSAAGAAGYLSFAAIGWRAQGAR